MLKRILTAVLMLVVLLVVNSAGASNTVRIAYSDIDNFVGIKDGRLAGYGVALFDAIAEYTGAGLMNIKAVRGNSVWSG